VEAEEEMDSVEVACWKSTPSSSEAAVGTTGVEVEVLEAEATASEAF